MIIKFNLLAAVLLLVLPARGDECIRPEKQLNVAKTEIENKRYHVVTHFKANYFIANEYCHYLGMDMASIETDAQNIELWNYINYLGYGTQYFWLSGSDMGHEGKFVWTNTGLRLTYTNMASGQPDNSLGNENCLEIRDQGKWNDNNCLVDNHFVCQF